MGGIFYQTHHRHPHWTDSRSVSWLGEVSLVLRCYLILSLQYLSMSSLHRLTGLRYRLFLPYDLQRATRETHRSSLRRLVYPAQDNFILRALLVMSMTFVFSQLAFLSLYVMLSIQLSILVCAIASLFSACLGSVQVSSYAQDHLKNCIICYKNFHMKVAKWV